MTPKITSAAELIESHEGRKSVPYADTLGKLSVGVGHCLDTKPIDFEVAGILHASGIDPRVGPWPDDAITLQRNVDIDDARKECHAIFSDLFDTFAGPRQACLTDMAFQLGEHGLRAFVGMHRAIDRGDWDAAAAAALDSVWARQTPARARMNAEILRTGQWPQEG